ncbi:MAG: hypothetical protein AAGK74_00060 [Chloroflexota bacterium]
MGREKVKPPIGGPQHLKKAKAGFEREFKPLSRSLADSIRGDIGRVAGLDGTIPRQQGAALRTRIEQRISDLYTGPDGLQAYEGDTARPLAPYPRLLNKYLAEVQINVIESHRPYMRRQLSGRPDVIAWLESAQLPVQETMVPNPLLQYDPAHTWVDPRGYRLSDRIWQVSQRVRDAIDRMLLDAIRSGMNSIELANQLEASLQPGRRGVRTRRPYNRDVSFDAMRLARTEITRAFGESAMVAARSNPYVDGMEWALSASHPRIDICDDLATIGMGGGRLRDPYPVGSLPGYPPHPQCLCTLFPSVTRSPSTVTNRLYDMHDEGLAPPMTTLAEILIGEMLESLLFEYIASLTQV